MKKLLLCLLALTMSMSLAACSQGAKAQPAEQTAAADEAAIRSVVEKFGSKLQTVSLQAPNDLVKRSMQDNYSEFVIPGLLAKWQSDPIHAPGRLTSSPWPDRIDIASIKVSSAAVYQVEGSIIEITSTEKPGTGEAARRPITLVLKKSDSRWMISDATVGEYARTGSIVYRNAQYGLRVTLPATWQGYTVVVDKWEGVPVGGSKVIEKGPLLLIRHPQWTAQKPRQDIPVQVFTLNQWSQLQQEKFHIGAAPMGPKELARNSKYVFGLPARYNYAFPEGFEEVDRILQSNAVQAE